MSEAAGRTRAAERRQTESIPPVRVKCTNRGAAGRHLCSFILFFLSPKYVAADYCPFRSDHLPFLVAR